MLYSYSIFDSSQDQTLQMETFNSFLIIVESEYQKKFAFYCENKYLWTEQGQSKAFEQEKLPSFAPCSTPNSSNDKNSWVKKQEVMLAFWFCKGLNYFKYTYC